MDPRAKTEITVQGIAASQGIAYGQIFVYLQSDVEVPSYQVEPEKRIDEVARFDVEVDVAQQPDPRRTLRHGLRELARGEKCAHPASVTAAMLHWVTVA